MFKPIEMFNDIVSGVILGLYDISVLLAGPLIALLSRRRFNVWRFVLGVESRVSSLTMMFMLMAAIIAVDYPVLQGEMVDEPERILDNNVYGLAEIMVLATVMTIVFDVIFRVLVFLRRLCLNVKFSQARLAALRLHFCTGLLAVFVVDSVELISWFTSERREFHEYFRWPPTVRVMLVCIATIPFSFSIFHLTYRLRGWKKWPVVLPFTYSFVNIALSAGFTLGVYFTIFSMFGPYSQQTTRLYSFNTRCRMAGASTVSVESDLLLKTNRFEAVTLNSLFANIGNQIVELSGPEGVKTILISGKVVRSHWQGTFLKGVEAPKLGSEAAPCSLLTSGVFWNKPERVQDLGGG